MTKIDVARRAQDRNDEIADENRRVFAENGVFVMNLIGSPGGGKTSILEYTARHCDGEFAVVVGDVKTALDADRILDLDIPAVAIETGGGCHLSAEMVQDVLSDLDLAELDFLFVHVGEPDRDLAPVECTLLLKSRFQFGRILGHRCVEVVIHEYTESGIDDTLHIYSTLFTVPVKVTVVGDRQP